MHVLLWCTARVTHLARCMSITCDIRIVFIRIVMWFTMGIVFRRRLAAQMQCQEDDGGDGTEPATVTHPGTPRLTEDHLNRAPGLRLQGSFRFDGECTSDFHDCTWTSPMIA